MKRKNEYMGIYIIVLISIALSRAVFPAGKAFLISGLPTGETDAQIPKSLAYHERDKGISSVIHTRDIITIQRPEDPITGYQGDVF